MDQLGKAVRRASNGDRGRSGGPMRFFAALALALTTATVAFARAPMPTSMRGMVDKIDFEKDCGKNDDCSDFIYRVRINVNEKFVHLPLSQQTPRIHELALWLESEPPAEADADAGVKARFAVHAALNTKLIGWADDSEWIWDAAYVAAINRRALK
jgi:hypothetical protein